MLNPEKLLVACRLEFKDKNISLCYFILFIGNFRVELGPAAFLKLKTSSAKNIQVKKQDRGVVQV